MSKHFKVPLCMSTVRELHHSFIFLKPIVFQNKLIVQLPTPFLGNCIILSLQMPGAG